MTKVHLRLILLFVPSASLFWMAKVQAQSESKYSLKPKTVAWGYYDAKAAPVLRVKSGDTPEEFDSFVKPEDMTHP